MVFTVIGFVDFINTTQLPEQISNVDAKGLFSNGYFLTPFLAVMAYLLYKQAFKGMILVGIGIGCWFASGTQYMSELVVDGEAQFSKILPVMIGGIVVLATVVYLLFGRSD